MNVLDIALSQIWFLTTREKNLLKKNIDSLDTLAILSIEDISSIVGRTLKAAWSGKENRGLAEKAALVMESKGIGGTVNGSKDYPAMLGTIADLPYALFYRGNLDVLLKKCVSVVGTRRICRETATAAMEFARQAADNCQTVISGLAAGIDTFAHKGALGSDSDGTTAAVLPCGIESVVPYSNRGLAGQILRQGGLVCSEYVPGVPAEPWRFLQRNRLIAALSSATVVIQAPKGSGALVTADFALAYDRDLMFHKAGFCEEAKKKGSFVKKSKSRAPDAQWYVSEGAPIIENYADYVRVMESPPGTYGIKDRQLELF